MVLLLAGSLEAQSSVRLSADARIRKAPGAQLIGTLLAGSDVVLGKTQGSAREVQLQGWIPAGSVRSTKRDGFDLLVAKRPEEVLRAKPDGPVIARLTVGVGLSRAETQGTWVRVQRTVWVDQKGLATGSTTASAPAAPAGDQAAFVHKAPLVAAPGGGDVGSADSGAAAHVLSSIEGWTHVQIDAWVPDSFLHSTDSQVLVGVSEAEVRADPARYVGKLVEWRVQFIALQKADELRPEIPMGQPYLLTRGPLPEPGFVYVVVPSTMAAQFQSVPALKELTIRGTIRSASTKYLPTPVLDLAEVVRGLKN